MDNLESQENEIIALTNIYEDNELIVDGMSPPCGRFLVNVRLPDNFLVMTKAARKLEAEQASCSFQNTEAFNVEYLPPIQLFFSFPESYPQETGPAFLLSCNWLTFAQLCDLCKHLEALWLKSRDAILYTWFQFLQDEVLQFLNISQSLNITNLLYVTVHNVFKYKERIRKDPDCHGAKFQSGVIVPSVHGGGGWMDLRAFNDLSDGALLIPLLKDFNELKKEIAFKNSDQDCDICILTKKGSEFMTFQPCKHSFCKNCIKEYFEQLIKEGNLNSINCLHSDCLTQADPIIVKEMVCPELFEKYDRLLLSRALESMADVGFCPRRECQCSLIVDLNERMGKCPACRFIFCPFCKMTYHGIAPCNFKSGDRQKIFEEYMQGDSIVKERITKVYGKRWIKSLVEDTLSETWKTDNSKYCPRCQCSIEKSDGCNKMKCYKCGTFFCWLCLSVLQNGNPYLHYTRKGTDCFNRLFPENYTDEQHQADLNMMLYGAQPGEFLND